MTLQQFFADNPSTALAFSGGVDSAYLLYAAAKYGTRVKAYYVKTPFQPEFEYRDAEKLARLLGVPMQTLPVDILACPEVATNPANRCYHCKRQILSAIWAAAKADGFSVLMDGNNASDDTADRPGMRAVQELAVRSPLREAGLTKAEIRRLSKDAGLFTHDKPAYACLATRIPTGRRITAEDLHRTEICEGYLHDLGFSDFRIRLLGEGARIQLPQSQLPLLIAHRAEIVQKLKAHYSQVLLDLEVRSEH